MITAQQKVQCPVCQRGLTLKLAQGRKSGKTFLMLVCTQDGRHFRGFINDRAYVDAVLSRLEGHTPLEQPEAPMSDRTTSSKRSKTNLERGS